MLRRLVIFLSAASFVLSSCRPSEIEPFSYESEIRFRLGTDDMLSADALRVTSTKASATAVNSFDGIYVYWQCLNGGTVVYPGPGMDVNSSLSVSDGVVFTGRYWPFGGAVYDYRVANVRFASDGTLYNGSLGTNTEIDNTTDIIVGRATSVSNSTAVISMNHIFARTANSIVYSGADGYNISGVSFTLASSGVGTGIRGTYNIDTGWSAEGVTPLAETALTAMTDLYLIPGEYQLKATFTASKGGYSQTLTKTATITLVANKINNITAQLSGNLTDTRFSVSVIPWTTASRYPICNYLDFDDSDIVMPGAGGSVTLDVVSNGTWSFSGIPAWLTVSPASGSGNTTVTLSAPVNTVGSLSSDISILGAYAGLGGTIRVSQEVPYSSKYLTIEALDDGTLTLMDWSGGQQSLPVYYRINGGAWTSSYFGQPVQHISLYTGDIVEFKGTNNSYVGSSLHFSDDWIVYGNIMSLIGGDNFTSLDAFTQNEVFREFFASNSNLISAANLILPAMTLTQGCYRYMFSGCMNLISAPELPALSLPAYCYMGMFQLVGSITSFKMMALDIVDRSSVGNFYRVNGGFPASGTFTINANAVWDPADYMMDAYGMIGFIPNGWTVQYATQ